MTVKPIWMTTFSICKGSKKKVHVRVYRTRADMHAFWRDFRKKHAGYGPLTRYTAGFSVWHIYPREQRRFKADSLVCLCLPYSGVGVVSHEFTHIALGLTDPDRFKDKLVWDERVSYLQGALVSRYWQRYYRSPLATMQYETRGYDG